MDAPSQSSGRTVITGVIISAIVVAGLGFAAGRSGRAPPPSLPPVLAASTAAPTPSPDPAPQATPDLERGDLIRAAALAADAAAMGAALPAEVTVLEGQRFDIRLPFGCRGPTDDDTVSGWRIDPKRRTLRVRATPLRLAPDQWLPAAVAANFDAVEGFWIERPWTAADTCPVFPDSAGGMPMAPTERTLALVQIHSVDAPRVGPRLGEGYDVAVKLPTGIETLDGGLRLHLTGRVAAAPDSGPVICRSDAGPNQRPVCVIVAALDKVGIENAAGEVLGTWDVATVK